VRHHHGGRGLREILSSRARTAPAPDESVGSGLRGGRFLGVAWSAAREQASRSRAPPRMLLCMVRSIPSLNGKTIARRVGVLALASLTRSHVAAPSTRAIRTAPADIRQSAGAVEAGYGGVLARQRLGSGGERVQCGRLGGHVRHGHRTVGSATGNGVTQRRGLAPVGTGGCVVGMPGRHRRRRLRRRRSLTAF